MKNKWTIIYIDLDKFGQVISIKECEGQYSDEQYCINRVNELQEQNIIKGRTYYAVEL